MSDSGPEKVDRQELRKQLAHPSEHMVGTYGQDFLNDFADVYRRGRRIDRVRRWMMERMYPQEVADYTLLVIAEENVATAKLGASAIEGQTVIV